MTKTSEVQSHQIPQLTTEETLTLLATASSGLSQDEAQRRLTQNGKNVLLEQNRFSLVHGVLRHFTHFLAGSSLDCRRSFLCCRAYATRRRDGRAGMGHFGCHRD